MITNDQLLTWGVPAVLILIMFVGMKWFSDPKETLTFNSTFYPQPKIRNDQKFHLFWTFKNNANEKVIIKSYNNRVFQSGVLIFHYDWNTKWTPTVLPKKHLEKHWEDIKPEEYHLNVGTYQFQSIVEYQKESGKRGVVTDIEEIIVLPAKGGTK